MARRTVKAEEKIIDIPAMVDRGYELDQEIKVREKELKLIKAKLLSIGEKNGMPVIAGKAHSAVCSPNTKNTVNPKKFFNAMKELGKLIGFFECTTIGITKAKEYMNEYDLEEITTSETNEYGKISFK